MNVMVPRGENEALDQWIEKVNALGVEATVEELEELLEEAPEEAKNTSDYYYILGCYDMKFMLEKIY